MALEQSRFFDYTEDKPAEYQADEFAEFFRTFLSDGVPVMGTNLQITATDEGMFVTANYGAAMVQGYGYWLKNDETGIKQLDITAAHATYSRLDRIVLRRDKSVSVANVIMAVLSGTPSASPVPPALTREGNIYEISLAQVRVDPGVLSITADKVTDERADFDVCGYVENLSVRDQIAAIYSALTTGLAGKANISHTQAMSTITDLVATLAGKANTSHTQAMSTITDLVATLAGKANTSHTQAMSTITDLVATLAGKANTSHTQAMSTITGLIDALAGKLSAAAGAVETANIADEAITPSKLPRATLGWTSYFQDNGPLASTGNITIGGLSAYREMMVQIKAAAGVNARLLGSVIVPLREEGYSWPYMFNVVFFNTSGEIGYRSFIMTANNLGYTMSSVSGDQYLSVFYR